MEKKSRQLDIFLKLTSEGELSPEHLTQEYDISERTLYRDLKEIRFVLDLNKTGELYFNSDRNTYSLKLMQSQTLNLAEIVSISKILMNSRAFSKNEITHILTNLQAPLSHEQQKAYKKIVAEELEFYQPLTHNKDLLPLISDFIGYITRRETIRFNYSRSDQQIVTRENQPVSLFFSEYYFYSLFYSEKNSSHYPYRLDRFEDNIMVTKTNRMSPKIKLNEPEYKKNTHYMFSSGKTIQAKYKYWANTEVALDYFPNSKVIKEKNHGDDYAIIQTRAKDSGFLMWVMSQSDQIEIIEPLSLLNKVKEKIAKMSARYQ